MGLEYFKRPVLAKGFQVNGASTFTSDIVLSSTVAAGVGVAEAIQTISLTGASTTTVPHATTITNRGATFITSTGTGAGWTLNLASPGKKGVRKVIGVRLNGNSTVPVTIRTASSAETFWGSTRNGIVFSTANSTNPHVVNLLAASSISWAVVSMTTAMSALATATTA